jgi:hypothetical protein
MAGIGHRNFINQARRKHTNLSTPNTASRFDRHDIRDVVGEPHKLASAVGIPATFWWGVPSTLA